MEKRKRSRTLLNRFVSVTAVFIALIMIFLAMLGLFERISMQAMLRMNTEFSAQASSISESMQSIIHTIGTQVFYISSTAKLRRSTTLTNNERVFAMREVWQYVTASPMLHSIYVFNGKLNYVYTTDDNYFSSSIDQFYDRGAVELFHNRNRDNRMSLYYRTYKSDADYPDSRELFSYQVFEVTANNEVGDSAIMLNLDPDWFAENLLNFSGGSYIILSAAGYVVATQDNDLRAPAQAMLERIHDGASGYLIDTVRGEKTVCFYSPLSSNGWYCLRFVPYQDCLPGLSQLRSLALALVTALLVTLVTVSLTVLIRVYFPYRHMSNAISAAYPVSDEKENNRLAVKRLNEMVETSWKRRQEEVLRCCLSGQELPQSLAPPLLPATLLMAECLPSDGLDDLLMRIQPEAVVIQQEDISLILCAISTPLDAADLCNQLAATLGCRCYYCLPEHSLAQLPARREALLELRRLRFFSPGQRVFSETLLEGRQRPAEQLQPMLDACFAAAKSCKHDEIDASLVHLLEKLRACRHADILFVLKRLDYMLEAALADETQPDASNLLESTLARAQSPEDIIAYFAPRLYAVSDQFKSQKQSRERDVAAQIICRLEQGYQDASLNVQTIAEEMGLSPAYLRKQFFSVHNQSVGDYLNDLRIKEACRLLRGTSLRVEGIAQQIGFENTKYLYVLFKKVTGLTPRQYRMENQPKK